MRIQLLQSSSAVIRLSSRKILKGRGGRGNKGFTRIRRDNGGEDVLSTPLIGVWGYA